MTVSKKVKQKYPKMSTKSVRALGSMNCPICGRRGQLKLRENGYGRRHYQVDHYGKNGNGHSEGYTNSCYLGMKK